MHCTEPSAEFILLTLFTGVVCVLAMHLWMFRGMK